MPPILENVITGAVADASNHTVTVTWANGATTVNRFDQLVGKGVFTAFADPALFARVSVGERGRSLEWPNEIDFCADALWFEAHPEDGPQPSRRTVEQPRQHVAGDQLSSG
jgi:hypothetical protein